MNYAPWYITNIILVREDNSDQSSRTDGPTGYSVFDVTYEQQKARMARSCQMGGLVHKSWPSVRRWISVEALF